MIRMIRHALQTLRRLLFHFDEFTCTIPISCELDFIVYERPGAWCSDEQLSKLVDDLRMVAKAGQEGREIPSYGPLTGERKDLRNRIISVAYDRRLQRPVGFSAQSYLHVREDAFSTEVVHLGLIYVDPTYQGKSVSYLLSLLPSVLIIIKSGFRDTWVSSVSQVPAVVGLVAANFANVYPSHDAVIKQSFMHKKLGQLIMEQHREVFGVGYDAEYDSAEQIIRNSYTGGSDNMKKVFAEATPHRLDAVNAMCEQKLNYERGDDFLQLGQMGYKAVGELFRNKMKNLSRLQIGVNLLIMFAAISILPILRWIIPHDSLSQVRVRAQGIKNV
jgi:hypothetical protein